MPRPLIGGLLVAVGCSGPGPDSDTTPGATSYPGRTELIEAAAKCDGEKIVVTARTIGWHESAVVDFWANPSDSDAAYGSAVLRSDPDLEGGFSSDEFCDRMVAVYEPGLGGVSCAELPSLTILVRVNFEEGCAGCAFAGDGLDAIDSPLAMLPGQQCPHTPAECQGFNANDAFVPVRIGAQVASCPP